MSDKRETRERERNCRECNLFMRCSAEQYNACLLRWRNEETTRLEGETE